ncbi:MULTISPECIES: TRAP transporter small permease [unclassified Actinopolyspora]|uniref:TRAP transporter small permease n=1 Tax=unclassified Actinopolyspora TaxID=2639451 RepID=UPI0013F5E6FA|nr:MULTISPECIES: TRAP transporter small permease [unclassified Actinopolyspora]NHD15923.1 TRAP transporter small permease [Actinopolyspora sp. BKK2]NHE74863.1 TRAP transporter small permease [Actinopolyspora sp. BKK1]
MSQPASPHPVAARMHRMTLRTLDGITDVLTTTALAAMVVVISWQVFCRFVLQFTPGWSSETALLLLAWLALLGIATGIRDHGHIALGVLVDRLPRPARVVIGRLAPALMVLFGIYLVQQGSEFTRLMASSTLPATGLPTSVRYAAMPVAGVLITCYSGLHLFGLLPERQPTRPDAATANDPGGDRDDEEHT